MSFAISCVCGAAYTVPDEHQNKAVQCASCNTVFTATRGDAGVDPVFQRDKFLLRQRAIAINQKYFVWDEQGRELLFIERPAHLLRNIGAALAAVLTGIVGLIIGLLIAGNMPGDALKVAVGVIAVLGAILGAAIVGIILSKKRDIYFYRDESKSDLLLKVFQDQKWTIFRATFSIADRDGNPLGLFYKNYLYNIIRKRWEVRGITGELICVAKEDSILLSLLRRLLGPLFGILRTNFVIETPNGDDLGQFNRKFTLLDRYVLDLTADPMRTLDRRVALALGVLLDTGEKR